MTATYNTARKPVTLSVRESFPAKSFGQETVYVPFADMPVEVLVELLEQGALRILNDGAGGKDKTDAEKIAGMRKRIDSWLAGSFRIKERGSAQSTLMWEAYIAEVQAKAPTASADSIRAKAKATVQDAFGKDESATFDAFLKALSIGMAKRDGEDRTQAELYDALVAKYEKAADELGRARAEAGKVEIDLTDIDI